MITKHKYEKCKSDECDSCYYCHLAVCSKCGLFEGSLTTHCPEQESYGEWSDKVYKEGWDYKDGEWYKKGDSFNPCDWNPVFEDGE